LRRLQSLALTFLRLTEDTALKAEAQTHLGESNAKRESMKLDSVLDSVERVEDTAEAYAREAGFDEDTASNISMVAGEAAANAILHGNKKDPAKYVTATFELTDAELKISIADEGSGLNPDQIPDPLAPENVMRTSGRGVFLMRHYMDEVHFRQLTPGTEITLVKRRG
jgi:serine/threonine-protein kinase RsbW